MGRFETVALAVFVLLVVAVGAVGAAGVAAELNGSWESLLAFERFTRRSVDIVLALAGVGVAAAFLVVARAR
ncbi:hypothetical protein [Halosegnis marinus]|uniref:Heme biosynthesis protein HemY n=1 Tax=Halosegnis marinus TaxID=3034023 RepID=A0ABD5ZTJ0_9EURY|nr:hypothetical protein [Halosegnis sp. DT85]